LTALAAVALALCFESSSVDELGTRDENREGDGGTFPSSCADDVVTCKLLSSNAETVSVADSRFAAAAASAAAAW
jgi:hypothetical protein